jgi:hypothetical protein
MKKEREACVVFRSKSRRQLIRKLNESRPYSLDVLKQIVFHKEPRIPDRREYLKPYLKLTKVT